MKVVAAEGGNKTRAAQRLGLDRKTLYRKLEEYAAAGGGGAARDERGRGRGRPMIRSEVRFSARVEPGVEPVRSPVTDQPCAYWRLRIVERLTAGSQLVHEMASGQAFRLVWGARDRAPVRIRVEPDAARIEAPPVLHRPGSPGALAVARAFGFPGVLSVEEIARPLRRRDRGGGDAVRSAPRGRAVSHGRARARAVRGDADRGRRDARAGAAAVGGRHGGGVPGRHRPRDLGRVALSRAPPPGPARAHRPRARPTSNAPRSRTRACRDRSAGRR